LFWFYLQVLVNGLGVQEIYSSPCFSDSQGSLCNFARSGFAGDLQWKQPKRGECETETFINKGSKCV
jgi:hypothetical protein